ncbi:MAG: hypothetical protein K2X37_12030 [Chitinophagaceae bacterium]|nr:hypothetical protein [Chitinophagaceae bacterium]
MRTAILVFLANMLFAGDIKAQSTSYFKAGGGYLTNSVFNGRADSATIPYITPSLGYFDKSGFYVNALSGYLKSAATSRFDFFSIETGYDKEVAKNLTVSLYASKDFYNSQSENVRSDIKGSASVGLSYGVGPIVLSATPNFVFTSAATDIFFSGGISAPISWEVKNNEWSLTPALNMNFGTQNYHEEYIKSRKNRGTRRVAGTTTTVEAVNPSVYKLQVIELSVPLSYETSTFIFSINPSFAVPYNAATYKTTVKAIGGTGNGIVNYETENLSNRFYAEISVYYKF